MIFVSELVSTVNRRLSEYTVLLRTEATSSRLKRSDFLKSPNAVNNFACDLDELKAKQRVYGQSNATYP